MTKNLSMRDTNHFPFCLDRAPAAHVAQKDGVQKDQLSANQSAQNSNGAWRPAADRGVSQIANQDSGNNLAAPDATNAAEHDELSDPVQIKHLQEKLAKDYKQLAQTLARAKASRITSMINATRKGKRLAIFDKIYKAQDNVMDTRKRKAQKHLDYKTFMIRTVTVGEVDNVWLQFFDSKQRLREKLIAEVSEKIAKLNAEYSQGKRAQLAMTMNDQIQLYRQVAVNIGTRPEVTSLSSSQIESDLYLLKSGGIPPEPESPELDLTNLNALAEYSVNSLSQLGREPEPQPSKHSIIHLLSPPGPKKSSINDVLTAPETSQEAGKDKRSADPLESSPKRQKVAEVTITQPPMLLPSIVDHARDEQIKQQQLEWQQQREREEWRMRWEQDELRAKEREEQMRASEMEARRKEEQYQAYNNQHMPAPGPPQNYYPNYPSNYAPAPPQQQPLPPIQQDSAHMPLPPPQFSYPPPQPQQPQQPQQYSYQYPPYPPLQSPPKQDSYYASQQPPPQQQQRPQPAYHSYPPPPPPPPPAYGAYGAIQPPPPPPPPAAYQYPAYTYTSQYSR